MAAVPKLWVGSLPEDHEMGLQGHRIVNKEGKKKNNLLLLQEMIRQLVSRQKKKTTHESFRLLEAA